MTPTSISRDIKLGITTGEYDLTVHTDKLPGWKYYFFNKKRKIIKDLLKRGFLLTGSRALDCYKINNKELLNRKPNDWDFIVTKQQFLTLCKDYKIYNFSLSENQYLLDKSFATFYSGYGDNSYWFPCLIQLIIKDDEVGYNEKDGIRFASLEEIITTKVNMCKNNSKHRDDINNIIVNLCG